MTASGIQLIGRDAEVDRVSEAVRAMVGGRGGVVVVAGEAGIGKSRLVQEIVERADADGIATAAGQCSPVSEALLPYAPVVDVLRDVMRRCPDLSSSVTPEVWTGVAPLLGHEIRPGGVDQALASTRLFAGVVEVLRAFGDRLPALVVIEDVHWADPATADLLAFVARKISTARVLLLVTARREAASGAEQSTLITGLLRLPTTSSVYLTPLTGSGIIALLQQVSVLPDSAAGRRVQAVAGGIPFFILHLATRDAAEVIPPDLRDLLSATIQHLTSDERDILVLLTILGDGADVDLLLRASGISLQALNRAVRSLWDRGVLVRRGGSVVFRHALMREVATDETLPGEIQLAHSRVADALLTLNPRTNEAAAPLGRHLAAAGRHDEGLRYLVSGARQAMDLCAFADAAAQYERATRCWPLVADAAGVSGVAEAVLWTELAIAYRWCGRLTDALHVLDHASVLSAAAGDQLAMVEHARGQVLWADGDMAAALQAYRRAATAVDEDGPQHAPIMAALAHGLMATGRAEDAVNAARDAIRLASRAGVDRVSIHAEITEAAARAQLGDVDAAVDLLRSCLPRARRLDDIELVYRCYGNLTFALGLACRYAELTEAAKEGAEVCNRYGPVVSLASTVLNNEVAALIQLGRWAEATRLSIAALRDPAAVGIEALLHVRLAEIAVAMGDDDQAGRNIAAAQGLESDDHYTVSSLCIVKAERALGKGDPVGAVVIVTGSLAGLQAQDDAMPLLEACCFGLRAQADAAAQAAPHPRRTGPSTTPDLRSIAMAAHDRSHLPLALANAVLLMCDAEHARARRADTAPEWAAAAAANDQLGRRYARAYCLLRQATAELRHHARAAAADPLTLALQIAESLGAQPLVADIKLLARAGNLPLQSVGGPVASPSGAKDVRSEDHFRLTEREGQVLDLLTDGATNRTIARRLFISERTASVHVSNILRKFGVSNRTEAAQVALVRRLANNPPSAAD